MKQKQDIMDTQSEETVHNDGNSDLERLLAGAFGSLSLFVDRNDPLFTQPAMARAHLELGEYKRWRESGAPINGVVVRLAEGAEMNIIKWIAHMLPPSCSFRDLLPDAVLSVYKKADKHFGEVLLYRVAAGEIPPEGFIYQKSYPNKQTLFLQVEHGQDGQLNVTVDYTLAEEVAPNRSRRWIRWIPVLGPSLLALAGLLYLAGRKFQRDDSGAGQSIWVTFTAMTVLSVMAVAFAVSSLSDSGAGVRVDFRPEREAKSESPVSSPDGNTGAATNQPASVANGDRKAADHPSALSATPSANGTANVNDRSRVNTATDDTVTDGGANKADPVPASKPENATANANIAPNATVAPGAAGVRVIRTGATGGDDKMESPPVAVSDKQQIQIYVKVFVYGDEALETELLRTFVTALRQTDRFIVFTDEQGVDVPKNIYEVNLDYVPEGTILARLYNTKSNQIWDAKKNCQEYPNEKILAIASKEMVSKILPKVTSAEAKKSNGG